MTIKIHKLVTSFLAIVLLGSACTELDEEPVGLLAPESFFSTASDAEAAVLGGYSMMSRDLYYGRILPMTLQLLGDQVTIGDIGTLASRVQLNSFTMDASNGNFTDIWASSYMIIGAANAAIAGIPGISMDEERKNQLIGEARITRALAYYHLVQLFGDIPYLTDPIKDPSVVADIAKTPAADVYANMLEDVTYAATVLPATYPGNVRSRATKGTAHTLLSNIYLIQENWAKAAEHAEHVINNAATYNYALMPDYKNLWNADLGNINEHIWTVDFLGGALDFSNNNRANVDYTVPMNNVRGADHNGWSVTVTTEKLYDFFPDADYRKDVSFLTETLIDGVMKPYTEFTWPYIHIAKWGINPGANANGDGTQSDHNYVIFRYAEVLLMAAEALNEANGGPTPEAYRYLNAVRARARNKGGVVGTFPEDLAPGLSQEAFRQAVRDERVYELAFEWKRWYDLKRWGIVVDAFTGPDSFEPQPAVKPFNVLMPIPQRELDLNENLLPQNSGY